MSTGKDSRWRMKRWYKKVMAGNPPCAVSETMVGQVMDPCSGPVEAHHLAGRHKHTKYDASLGMPLCAHHHRHSTVCSPHAAPVAFRVWLETYHPDLAEEVKQHNRRK